MKNNQIKVFHPRSKRADFTISCVSINAGVKKLGELLDEGADRRVAAAFRSLKQLGADSLSFHHLDRKIKVELAKAA